MCGLLARWMRTNACFCRRKDLQPVMLECSSLIELSFLRTEYSNEISSGYHTILQIASTLNLEIQKSKIPLVRSGSLKDRRKPSAASRRKSFRSSFNEDFDDSFVISEGEESWVLLLPDIVEAVHYISDMNSSVQISRELRQRWLIGCEWYWIRTYGFFFGGGGQTTLICVCALWLLEKFHAILSIMKVYNWNKSCLGRQLSTLLEKCSHRKFVTLCRSCLMCDRCDNSGLVSIPQLKRVRPLVIDMYPSISALKKPLVHIVLDM